MRNQTLPTKGRRGIIQRFMTPALLVLATLTVSPTLAQTVVRGTVKDETGATMPGVNVLVKNTTIGTATDANGTYSISAPDGNSVLVFSFIGYATSEESVGGRTTIDISLAPNVEQLSEVVVVGYGTQRKRDVTGAVVSLSSETLKEVPGQSNVFNQLKGRAAGVDVISNSSTPGGTGQIRIRGNRSLSTTNTQLDALDQPLLVVDGIPYGGSISDINPDDVSSMEILKDASATAIYGSRGSGGVILITTKRGKSGKPVLSFDTYWGVSNIMGKLNVFNGEEYAAFKAESAAGNSNAPGTTPYPLTAAEQTALAAGVSTDWQDLIYQQGSVANSYLNISGGSNGTTYSLGAGFFKETGIIPHQDFTRGTIRATIDSELNKFIKVGINTLNTLGYTNTPGGAGVPVGLMRTTPLADAYNADGSVNLLPQAGSTDGGAVSPITLLTKNDAILARNRRLRTFNSVYGEVSILEGLKYRLNVGLDFRQEQQDSYNGALTYTNNSPAASQTNASVRNLEAWTYTIENLINYDKTFATKHRVGLTGLFSVQKDHSQNTGMLGLGIPVDYVQNYNLALASTLSAINPGNAQDNPNNYFERGLISYMARATYGFDGRYNITATVRKDGSSVLSPGNQYFTYPAFAAGWNLSNEQFMSGVSSITNLKLRAGWGKTSNQGIPAYSTLGALNSSAYNFGQGASGQQLGYTVTTLPNNTLKWQSTAQSNIGLEFGALKNRITGVIEVYWQNTSDILLSVLLPPSNGASSTLQNLGKTKGHGLEMSITTVNIKAPSGFTWETDWIYFFNREEIVQLTTPDEKMNVANGWFVGQPLTVIYDVKKVGIWQTTDDTERLAQVSPAQLPGQIRVEDINGRDANNVLTGLPDGRITADDRQIIGNFQPKWEGGMTNRFSYKNFDFTFVLYARMGMKVLVPYVSSDGSFAGYTFFMQGRNNQLKVDYWTPSNPTNEFPRPDAFTDRPLFSSTLAYMDGSFIKMRSINLGYTVPTAALTKARIQSLRFYVTAVNPFVLYSPFVKGGFGPDPEGNGYGGGVASPQAGYAAGQSGAPGRQVSVNANNPSTRQFSLGLNLRF